MASNPFFLSFRALCFYHLSHQYSCCLLGVTGLTRQIPCPFYNTRFSKVIHVIHKGVPKKALSTFFQHKRGTSPLPSLAYSPKPPHKNSHRYILCLVSVAIEFHLLHFTLYSCALKSIYSTLDGIVCEYNGNIYVFLAEL